jgi:hypothetical protein
MREEEKIILYDSDEAAVYEERTLKGWWSKLPGNQQRFWKDDEHMARYDGCTHRKCDCGELTKKHYTACQACREKKDIEKYNKLESIEWDGETPIYSDSHDEYFFDLDILLDFAEDREVDIEDLRLILCVPQYANQIDYDYFCDQLPEDGDLPADIEKAMNVFNEVIKNSKPLSWYPGNKRVIIKESE